MLKEMDCPTLHWVTDEDCVGENLGLWNEWFARHGVDRVEQIAVNAPIVRNVDEHQIVLVEYWEPLAERVDCRNNIVAAYSDSSGGALYRARVVQLDREPEPFPYVRCPAESSPGGRLMAAGRLSAELDGPHARFTIEYPERPADLHPEADWYDHLAVERYHGMKQDVDRLGNLVFDANGAPVMVEDWRHIHHGSHKYVKGDTDVHARWPEPPPHSDHPDYGKEVPPPGPHRYKALAYRVFERPKSGVRMLENVRDLFE